MRADTLPPLVLVMPKLDLTFTASREARPLPMPEMAALFLTDIRLFILSSYSTLRLASVLLSRIAYALALCRFYIELLICALKPVSYPN